MIAGISIGVGLAAVFFLLSYGAGQEDAPILAAACASGLFVLVVGTGVTVAGAFVGEIWTWARGSRRVGQ